MADVRVVSIACLGSFHILIDHVRILTVGHYGEGKFCCRTESLLQRFTAVDKHISSRCSHEEFYPGNCVGIKPREQFAVIVCSTEEKTVVYMT